MGSGDSEKLEKLQKKQKLLKEYIETLSIKTSLISAFIHYEYTKSKTDMLKYFTDHYLTQSIISSCTRKICCIEEPQPDHLFKGSKLYLR